MNQLHFETPLGTCVLEWDAEGIEAVRFPSAEIRPTTERDREEEARLPEKVAVSVIAIRAIFEGKKTALQSPWLNWSKVSAFQRAVYEETLKIPQGETRTYGEIAASLGLPPGGSRAVGNALGANPWPLLVPCHRVLGANGRMTGFSAPGGTRAKVRLLALEGNELPGLF